MSAPSVLMYVGEQYYKLWEFIAEAEQFGVSKRIPSTAIPEGIVPGISKVFVAHAKAIVKVTAEGKALHDLAYELVERELLTPTRWAHLVELDMPYWTGQELQPYDEVPGCMLDITEAFSKLPEKDQGLLINEYGLAFHPGVFGYSPITSVQVVLGKDENDLPGELEHLRPLVESGYVQPVHVEYVTEGGYEGEEDGELL